jgi:DNA processing protein
VKEKLKYWVWLSSLNKITSRKRFQLLGHFKAPENIWNASKTDLKALPLMTREVMMQLLDEQEKDKASELLKIIKDLGVSIITIEDRLYPDCLRNIYDPPVVLYMKGQLVEDEKAIAVVGSRNATSYGLKMAESLSYHMAGYGITVTSGMARGVDSHAHKGAINAGGRTIAVLGCGLDIVYPPENKSLMEKIVRSGAVISEYLPGIQPMPYNFPARNRIISGISVGVVIVEAGERSGSLITADFALEQGREVFAVPGNACSLYSVGTNRLIKDGAKMVTEVEDIFEELRTFDDLKNNESSGLNKYINKSRLQGLSGSELKIIECISLEPLHVDTILQKSGLSAQEINSILVMLELKGVISKFPGNIFGLK